MPIEIEPLRHTEVPPQATPVLLDWPHRFGGANGCSLTATPLAKGYEIAWAALLPGDWQPEYLLAAGDRVLAVSRQRDRLAIAHDGAVQGEIRGQACDWCIDLQQRCVLGTNPAGDASAWELENPDLRYTLWGHLSDNTHHFSSEGDRAWVVAPVRPRLGGRPSGTDIEAYRIIDLRDANSFHITRRRATPSLGSAKVHGLHRVAIAVSHDELGVALPDGLHLFEHGMKPKATIPWLGAESAGCIALATHGGQWADLRPAEDGVALRLVAADVPPIQIGLGSAFRDAGPPIATTRGHWMLISSTAMALVRPNGEVAWERVRSGPTGGISGHESNCQIWAEHHRLLAYHGTGGHVVAELPAPLVTAPVAGADLLFVASSTHIFALAPSA